MEQKEKQNVRACPKDCRQCGMAQQMYCACQLSFTSFEAMSKIYEKLELLEDKVNAIQNAENGFLSPLDAKQAEDDTTGHKEK